MFLSHRRHRAPVDDGGVLIDPPLADLAQLFDPSLSRHQINGIALAELRETARREVLELATAYHHQFDESVSIIDSNRWIVAGHQPELFHPGVWLKNFVLARLGRDHRAVTLNVIVDNDEVKTNAIRVPTADGTIINVPFDRPVHGIAFEEWRVGDEELFRSVPERLAAVTSDWKETPLAHRYWAKALEHGRRTLNEDRFAPARRYFESQWGTRNLELPVSWLCRTKAFAMFVQWIVGDLERFRECYNGVVHEYRQAHGIRSLNHPVSDLARDEAPFWTWTKDNPKRTQLFIRPGRPCDEAIIRPRALTLTMFARMALGDLFIHGIGGAKYDELTDAIAERFFGIQLAPYMVVSGTLRLPFQLKAPADIQQLERQRRELLWNPQRVLRSAALQLAAERDRVLKMPTTSKAERRDRTRALRENLHQWQPHITGPLARIDQDMNAARRQQSINTVLQSREYPFILFSEDRLRSWFDKVTSA